LKSKSEIFRQTAVLDHVEGQSEQAYDFKQLPTTKVADPILDYMNKVDLEKALAKVEKDMYKAAKNMEYMEAARLRDEVEMLKQKIKEAVWLLFYRNFNAVDSGNVEESRNAALGVLIQQEHITLNIDRWRSK